MTVQTLTTQSQVRPEKCNKLKIYTEKHKTKYFVERINIYISIQ